METLPDPEPAAGEVRVRIHVSGVNPTDWRARTAPGALAWPWKIPNQDGAGVIDAVGAGVDPGRVGQRVWVYHAAYRRQGGTAAEEVCLPEAQAVPLPDQVSYAQGAGLGIPFMTAQHCLTADREIDGCTVLVTGGAGAVGNAAIQLAKHAGSRVITTVSSVEKAELARLAGADVVIDYREQDVPAQLAIAAQDGIDVVVDVAFETNLLSYADALADHARIASYASSPQPNVTMPLSELRARNVRSDFVLVYELRPAELDAAVSAVSAALRVGALAPLPEHRFALDDIAAAHEAVQDGAVGKVLVDVS